MRSRFTGKRMLLAAAVAGAAATAAAVPAQAAPPPDSEAKQVDDCAEALDVLSSFKLLPTKPDLGRTVCSLVKQQRDEKDPYTNEVHTEYTDDNGKKVESDTSLGPVEWLKSLTVQVPTVDDHWYSYTSKRS